MTHNFAYDHVTSWKAGGHSTSDKSYNRVVSYDQTFTAYKIDPEHHDDFVEWVASTWEIDDMWIGEQTAYDYLDANDIQII